ncbi:hypothetical protein BJV78DRAFT_1213787 [Lactifluus subvellereus]|nr:hypothetical protein BJV78DRAFT_1213787 [Lactifluus subvellereus]
MDDASIRPGNVIQGQELKKVVTRCPNTCTHGPPTASRLLPALTHLTPTTHGAQPQAVINEVLAGACWVFTTCPYLAILILILDHVNLTIPSSTSSGNCNRTLQGPGTPIFILSVPWCIALACQHNPHLHGIGNPVLQAVFGVRVMEKPAKMACKQHAQMMMRAWMWGVHMGGAKPEHALW